MPRDAWVGGGRAVVRAQLFFPIEIKLSPSPTQQARLGPTPTPGSVKVAGGRRRGAKRQELQGVFQAPVLSPPPLRCSSPPLGTRGVFWGHRAPRSCLFSRQWPFPIEHPGLLRGPPWPGFGPDQGACGGGGFRLPPATERAQREGAQVGAVVAAARWGRGSEEVRPAPAASFQTAVR